MCPFSTNFYSTASLHFLLTSFPTPPTRHSLCDAVCIWFLSANEGNRPQAWRGLEFAQTLLMTITSHLLPAPQNLRCFTETPLQGRPDIDAMLVQKASLSGCKLMSNEGWSCAPSDFECTPHPLWQKECSTMIPTRKHQQSSANGWCCIVYTGQLQHRSLQWPTQLCAVRPTGAGLFLSLYLCAALELLYWFVFIFVYFLLLLRSLFYRSETHLHDFAGSGQGVWLYSAL